MTNTPEEFVPHVPPLPEGVVGATAQPALPATDEDDFPLPPKACDLGRPESCESCQ